MKIILAGFDRNLIMYILKRLSSYAAAKDMMFEASYTGEIIRNDRLSCNVDLHSGMKGIVSAEFVFGEADIIIASDPAEAYKYLNYLKFDGKLVICMDEGMILREKEPYDRAGIYRELCSTVAGIKLINPFSDVYRIKTRFYEKIVQELVPDD